MIRMLGLLALSAGISAQDTGTGALWHTDLDTANALATESGRPLCIVFR